MDKLDRKKAENKWRELLYMFVRGKVKLKYVNDRWTYHYLDGAGNWRRGQPDPKPAVSFDTIDFDDNLNQLVIIWEKISQMKVSDFDIEKYNLDEFEEYNFTSMNTCLDHLCHRDVVAPFVEIAYRNKPLSRNQLMRAFALTEREARTLHKKYNIYF